MVNAAAFVRHGAVALAALSAFLAAPAPPPGVLNVPEAGITLKMPAIQKVAMVPSGDPLRVRELRGRLGLLADKQLAFEVWFLPNDRFSYAEPSELTDDREKRFAELVPGQPFAFTERQEIAGPFGPLPYAEYATGELLRGGDPKRPVTVAMGAFIGEPGACSIEVVVEPAASAEELESIHDALTQGVTVAGTPRDPRWSDGDARRRWDRDVPAKVQKDPMKAVERSDHYVVLTNSAGGAAFAKKMEEHCAKVKAVLPFPELPERRLLPIFLFRTREQYDDFCDATKGVGAGAGAGTGARPPSKGHAAKDFYATWAESPGDPVHLREATRQWLRNRFGLAGGGAWFQEGLAEYVATKRDERNAMALRVAKGKATPLRELFEPQKPPAANEAHDRDVEAALFIEFVHESSELKGKFADFVSKVGRSPRRSAAEREKALRASLGLTLDELQQAFTNYCVNR